ncbi:hypothetical protein Dform_01941 [Dehalogenimonas formicexedens]|uniref:Uncharacterized protein n=1 Tax=Dehalogenimonas formicexedens TaxID=1839801 RepID=A0A1P8F9X8_9CHLR|nr:MULTISPECIES: hypothetical protein [Dehalogenimonas]APV45255.1 hypothetical protein Dform_01941 [Dehalogenimonas formicexedens]
MDDVKAVSRLAAIEKASGGIFTHTTPDILAQVGAVELIDGFDDAFQKPPGRAVVNRLIDRNYLDAFITKQCLVSNRVGAAPGETVKLPNKDGRERRILGPGQGDHFLKRRSRSSTPAFRFVDEFAYYPTIGFGSVLTNRTNLG